MRSQRWAWMLVTSLLVWAASGCCCVNSCYTAGGDFGGAGCNSLCGSSCGSGGCGVGRVVASAGCASGSSCGGCGECGDCGGTAVGSYDLGSCNVGCGPGWNAPQFFVDDCGNPCYGPVVGLVHALRNAYIGCGCGPMYVDEWVSDPPDCNDPCGAGCSGGCGTCGGGGTTSGCGGCGNSGCNGSCGNTPLDHYYAKRKQQWGSHSAAAGENRVYTTANTSTPRTPRGSMWGTQSRGRGTAVAQRSRRTQEEAVRPASHGQPARPAARNSQVRPANYGQPARTQQAPAADQRRPVPRDLPSPPSWIRQVNWFN